MKPGRILLLLGAAPVIAGHVLLARPTAVLAHMVGGHGPETATAFVADPLALVGLGTLGILYGVGLYRLHGRAGSGLKRRLTQRTLLFAGAWLALAGALVSPLDRLSQQFFSAHMVQHELLMLIAPPLLILARPSAALAWSLSGMWRKGAIGVLRNFGFLWRRLVRPGTAWLLHGLVLWIWHLPVLFEAALSSTAVHWLQHASFLFAGLVFWHSLVADAGRYGIAVFSLFTTAAHASLLGALLTFSPVVWYPSHRQAEGGLTALQDQQLGGLIMWMPAGAIYVAAALVLINGLLAHAHKGHARPIPATPNRWQRR